MITRKRIVLSVLVVFSLLLTVLSAITQEGRIVRETIYSPSLEGNLLGDSPNRAVTIYLPPSYDTETDRRYPVVYLLHGYTGNHNLWTGGSYISGNILHSMKSWLNQGKIDEMILVMPNSYNRFRGSFYTNSVTTGNWADFIAKDLVEYINSNYRTLSQRESRGVIGHSMGGYGGVKLGMLYSEVFGCMGGMAGVYDVGEFISAIQNPEDYAIAATFTDWTQFYSSGKEAQFSWCGALAPNPDRPPFCCDFPFVYTDTKPKKVVKVQEVWDRFMEHDILRDSQLTFPSFTSCVLELFHRQRETNLKRSYAKGMRAITL